MAVRTKKKSVIAAPVASVIPFLPCIGHAHVLRQFRDALQAQTLAHAYGFFGPVSVGKTRVALEVAAMLLRVNVAQLAIHPDALIVHAGEEQVSLEQVRDVVSRMAESPFVAPFRVAVLSDVDQLSTLCANTLLKTLEEPRGATVLIITSSREEEVLPTMLSRVQRCFFYRVADQEMIDGFTPHGDMATLAAAVKLSGGAPGKALRFLFDSHARQQYDAYVAWWAECPTLPIVERFARLDTFFGAGTAFPVIQRIAHDLLDAAEFSVAKSTLPREAVHFIISARQFLSQNAAPRATMEHFVARF